MPAPSVVPPLPELPGLPSAVRLLAWFYLQHPRSSPDYILLLAEACEELGERGGLGSRADAALELLTSELSRRAPDYA